MTFKSSAQSMVNRAIGRVQSVSASRIEVLIHADSPRATSLNAGWPVAFPRINGFALIPNEFGATVGMISLVQSGTTSREEANSRRESELVDLPSQSRTMNLAPLGTLKAASTANGAGYVMQRGVDVFPGVGDAVLIPDASQLQAIVIGEVDVEKSVEIGTCPIAAGHPVRVDPDKLFGRHLAILGNTGSGKSCSVSGLINWSLATAQRARKGSTPNARFILLDPNGEYSGAFDEQRSCVFFVEPDRNAPENSSPLRVPAWLWNRAEWAAFTSAAPGTQRPVLFDALKRLKSQSGPPDQFETRVKSRLSRYLYLIKNAIGNRDHQIQGKREGVAELLVKMAADFEDLVQRADSTQSEIRAILSRIASDALEIEISNRGNAKRTGLGFWHEIFPEADLERLIGEIEALLDEMGFSDSAIEGDADAPVEFNIEDLPGYVDALASDRYARDLAQFVDTLNLRIRSLFERERLASIINPASEDSTTLEEWLENHISAGDSQKRQITIVDLSLVPEDVVHVVVAVIARMIFDAVQRYRRIYNESLPTVLVLDEAHTFVHGNMGSNETRPAARTCARVFERIAREGRKFGLGMVLASQRPSEVSETVLSQCNTFLLHRLVNDRDQELVRRLVPDAIGSLLRELPNLPTRRALLLGWAVPAPVLVEMREIEEECRPQSPDPDFWAVWTGASDREVDWATVARYWRDPDHVEDGGGVNRN